MDEKVSGIYCWLNTANGKRYVGQSVDIRNRRSCHLYGLSSGKSHCVHLQSAWTKYGKDSFKFQVCEEVGVDLLDERERFWISYYQSSDRRFGYNSEGGGNAGKVRSAETRAKMSAKMKGKVIPQEMRDRISKTLSGRTIPRDVVERMAKARTGLKRKPYSEQAIKNMIAGHANKKWSEKERADRLAKNDGWYFSKKQRDQIAEAVRKRVVTEETRKKRSMSLKGRPKSEEWKRKISEGHQRRQAGIAKEREAWRSFQASIIARFSKTA
jgi:group I intron endonuclease